MSRDDAKKAKENGSKRMIAGRVPKTQTQEIRLLLHRLKAFEQLPKTETNRSIIEIGIATIRDKLRDLSRFKHYQRGFAG